MVNNTDIDSGVAAGIYSVGDERIYKWRYIQFDNKQHHSGIKWVWIEQEQAQLYKGGSKGEDEWHYLYHQEDHRKAIING